MKKSLGASEREQIIGRWRQRVKAIKVEQTAVAISAPSKLLTPFKRGVAGTWRSHGCNESISGHGHIKIRAVGSSRPWLISVVAPGQKNTPATERQKKVTEEISERLPEFNPFLSSVPTQKCNYFNTSHKRMVYSPRWCRINN